MPHIKKQPKSKTNTGKAKLHWVKKKPDGFQVAWFEASVGSVGWVYVVDNGVENPSKYSSYLLFTSPPRLLSEVRLTSREFKTPEQAIKFCENHLVNTYKKLQKYFL
jgi:hypothetical protein